MHTYIHTYMQCLAYMHTYSHAYMHTQHTHIHAYILHAYIHTHIHTHIHTVTYMHTCKMKLCSHSTSEEQVEEREPHTSWCTSASQPWDLTAPGRTFFWSTDDFGLRLSDLDSFTGTYITSWLTRLPAGFGKFIWVWSGRERVRYSTGKSQWYW